MEMRVVIVAAALAVAGIVLCALAAAALGAARAAAKWPAAEKPALGARPAMAGLTVGAVLCGLAAAFAGAGAPVNSTVLKVAIASVAGLAALGLAAWAAVSLASRMELSALINSPSPMRGGPQTATSDHAAQLAATGYGQPYQGEVSAPLPGPPSSPSALPAIPAGTDAHTRPDGSNTTAYGSAYPATQPHASTAEVPAPSHNPGFDQFDPSIPDDALPGWVYIDDAENWYLISSVPYGRRLLRLTDFVVMPPTTAVGNLTLAGSIEMTVWSTEAGAETEPAPVAQPEPAADLESTSQPPVEPAPVAQPEPAPDLEPTPEPHLDPAPQAESTAEPLPEPTTESDAGPPTGEAMQQDPPDTAATQSLGAAASAVMDTAATQALRDHPSAEGPEDGRSSGTAAGPAQSGSAAGS